MNRTGKYLLYTVYTIGAVVFFLFMLFPSETLKRIIIEQMAAVQPDIEFETETIQLVFPPGLRVAPISLAYAGKPALQVDQIKIVPLSFFSFFRNQKNEDQRRDRGRISKWACGIKSGRQTSPNENHIEFNKYSH